MWTLPIVFLQEGNLTGHTQLSVNLAKEKVIAARKQTSNVQPEQLHLPSATKL
jgi:hypothetical protein